MSGRLKTALVVIVGVAASGCYVYEPVRPVDAIVDARVRATVTPVRAAELAPVLRNVTTQVTGTLVERTDGEILLEVPLYGAGLSTSRTVRNRISIPMSDLVGLEGRRLSRLRTAASVGAVVAAVAGGWSFLGGGDSVEDKQKTDVDNAVIAIFSLPLRLFR